MAAAPAFATDAPRLGLAALSELEALLRPCLGPMSRIVVREAARKSRTLAEVVAHIADHALTAVERPAFLRKARKLPGLVAAGVDLTATGSGPHREADAPLVARTLLTPETIDKAGRLLAQQGGPIAMLLARRAATGCNSREVFFQRLADAAAEMTDRDTLLAALSRLD